MVYFRNFSITLKLSNLLVCDPCTSYSSVALIEKDVAKATYRRKHLFKFTVQRVKSPLSQEAWRPEQEAEHSHGTRSTKQRGLQVMTVF